MFEPGRWEFTVPVPCKYCKEDHPRQLIQDTRGHFIGQICQGCGGPYQLPVAAEVTDPKQELPPPPGPEWGDIVSNCFNYKGETVYPKVMVVGLEGFDKAIIIENARLTLDPSRCVLEIVGHSTPENPLKHPFTYLRSRITADEIIEGKLSEGL